MCRKLKKKFLGFSWSRCSFWKHLNLQTVMCMILLQNYEWDKFFQVSAILSEPERLEQMAFPDYYQTSADHRRGLILVLPVGSRLNSNSFGRIRDRIINLTKVAVPAGTFRAYIVLYQQRRHSLSENIYLINSFFFLFV